MKPCVVTNSWSKGSRAAPELAKPGPGIFTFQTFRPERAAVNAPSTCSWERNRGHRLKGKGRISLNPNAGVRAGAEAEEGGRARTGPDRDTGRGKGTIVNGKQVQGQAFLELTLVLPVIFILIAGVIAVGLALSYKLKIEAVAREATRTIVKNTGQDSLELGLNRAETVARQSGFDPSQIEIKIAGVQDNFSPQRGSRVSAVVTYRYRLFNFVSIDITGSNTEIVECWRKRSEDTGGGSCVPPGEQD